MRLGTGRECMTEEMIRQVDRENRAERRGCAIMRIRKAARRAMRETLRFLALTAGTSLFAFIMIPAMEIRPERTLLLSEMLAVLAFGIWLGSKIYEPGRNRKK